jgi:hypothetical protein
MLIDSFRGTRYLFFTVSCDMTFLKMFVHNWKVGGTVYQCIRINVVNRKKMFVHMHKKHLFRPFSVESGKYSIFVFFVKKYIFF